MKGQISAHPTYIIVVILCCLIRFVRGKKPSQGSGFDLDYADLLEMEQCRGILVASAIFGIELLELLHCCLCTSPPNLLPFSFVIDAYYCLG